MRMTRIMWKRFKSPMAMGAGALFGVALTATVAYASIYKDIRQERAQLQQQLKTAAIKPDDKTDPIIEKMKNARIIGAGVVNTHVYYSFAPKDSKENEATFDSELITQAGGQVNRLSDCHAQVMHGAETADIYCL